MTSPCCGLAHCQQGGRKHPRRLCCCSPGRSTCRAAVTSSLSDSALPPLLQGTKKQPGPAATLPQQPSPPGSTRTNIFSAASEAVGGAIAASPSLHYALNWWRMMPAVEGSDDEETQAVITRKSLVRQVK